MRCEECWTTDNVHADGCPNAEDGYDPEAVNMVRVTYKVTVTKTFATPMSNEAFYIFTEEQDGNDMVLDTIIDELPESDPDAEIEVTDLERLYEV